MRACNFVMDMTPDVEEVQIRIRAMDFDQQSHNARKKFYLPQFFKENKALVFYCMQHLNPQTAMQYQREEQSLILRRMQLSHDRLRALLDVMVVEDLGPEDNVHQLRAELAEHYKEPLFLDCATMGQLVRTSLESLIAAHGHSATLRLRRPAVESGLFL